MGDVEADLCWIRELWDTVSRDGWHGVDHEVCLRKTYDSGYGGDEGTEMHVGRRLSKAQCASSQQGDVKKARGVVTWRRKTEQKGDIMNCAESDYPRIKHFMVHILRIASRSLDAIEAKSRTSMRTWAMTTPRGEPPSRPTIHHPTYLDHP